MEWSLDRRQVKMPINKIKAKKKKRKAKKKKTLRGTKIEIEKKRLNRLRRGVGN